MTTTAPALTRPDGAAQRLTRLLTGLLGVEPPLRLRCWDGSESGPEDTPLVVLRSPLALRHLLWSPGELGLARAYVTGELDVPGDMFHALGQVRTALPDRRPRLTPAGWWRALSAARALGALGGRPEPPAQEARLAGRLHTRARDRAAIAHHYDLGNDFYELLLDPSMAYSCGYWTAGLGDDGLAEAQRGKLELICRKLDLRPGMRLLDVGCGWGSLLLYAAANHGVRATGVTLSRQQHDHVRARIAAAGLADRVTVELRDYRDVADGPYDAISTVEMGEHVGDDQYPAFTEALHRLLAPHGRLLVQQMSRGRNAPGGGAFIERYIAPDMHMRPVGETVALIEGAGLEVRHVEALREHYTRTVLAWSRTLERNWDRFTAIADEPTARVWRLYLAGAALAFAQGRMGVDQILAVRPATDGSSGAGPADTRAPFGRSFDAPRTEPAAVRQADGWTAERTAEPFADRHADTRPKSRPRRAAGVRDAVFPRVGDPAWRPW